MNCLYCGAELSPGTFFCPECGRRVSDTGIRPQQQGYANQGSYPGYYAQQQPYIPQPPTGYAQPYYPAQPGANGGGNGNTYAPSNVASAQTLGVAEELAQVNREQSSSISGGIVFRNRSGEDGLSNLTDIEAPIQGRIRAGNGQ